MKLFTSTSKKNKKDDKSTKLINHNLNSISQTIESPVENQKDKVAQLKDDDSQDSEKQIFLKNPFKQQPSNKKSTAEKKPSNFFFDNLKAE